MTTGESKGFDLIVQANSGYKISVSSENNGRLKHVTNSSSNVGYDFGVNGNNISLVGSQSSPVDIYTSPTPSSQSGDVIEIDVSLQSTSGKISGFYNDYIYFTATSTY